MQPLLSAVGLSIPALCLAACAGGGASTEDPAGTRVAAAHVAHTSASNATIHATAAAPAASPPGELDVDPSTLDFSQNPELTSRIAESPHAYFRFVGHAFAKAVCKRFEAKAASLPRVRLHGDPHVEQYAVTDLGRGLSDYDDAAVGPQVVDLVRFGTSIVLAAQGRGLSAAETDKALAELFRGYADGLKGKAPPDPPPTFVAAMQAKFSRERKAFLEAAEKSVLPLDEAETKFARARLEEYLATVAGKEPRRPAGYYEVKRLGRLKLGIGSALSRKYLLRLEGPSKAEDDDVVMEIKEVSNLSSVPCVRPIAGGAAEQRADEQRRAAAAGAKLLAPALLPGERFWVNEWLANYQEANIKRLESSDLVALAYQVGLALGREHTKPLPDGAAPGADALAPAGPLKDEMTVAMRELAAEATRGWERFRRDVAKSGKP